MKNSIKCIKTIELILIAILLIFTTNVYAANDSFKTTLSVDNSLVKRGANITVTIALRDISIESGEKGIGAYTAKLDFDSSVLEYVSTSGTDNWETPLYQESQIVGTTSNGEVVNTNQNIGTITFKVKENAPLGETTIKLTNFSGSNAESDIPTTDTSIKITVVNNENGGNGGSGNGTGSGNGAGNGNNAGNGSSTGTVNGSTQTGGNNSGESNKENIKDGILPATGYSNVVICTLISIFVLMAVIFGIKIKLLNKKSNH